MAASLASVFPCHRRLVRTREWRGLGRQPLPLASDLTRFGAVARDLWRRVAAYAANTDPRVASCNTIALVVASNQPFYPLSVYFAVSQHIAPTLLTFLSTPFFLAIPLISRRSPVLGRALLPLTGLANVVVSAKAFGAASGVGIFIIPCALIAAAFFRPSERIFAVTLLALALAIFLGIDSRVFAPLHAYSQSEYAVFVRLNALSAGALVAFLGLILSGLVRE
jgi:hypothetical protein